MGIVHNSFLFYSERFSSEVAPYLLELEKGKNEHIRNRALQIIQENEKVLQVLDVVNRDKESIEKSDERNEFGYIDYASPLMAILAQHLIPIKGFDIAKGWREQYRKIESLRKGLLGVGWTDDECDILFYGNTLCALFENQGKCIIEGKLVITSPKRQAWQKTDNVKIIQSRWCEIEGGWIGVDLLAHYHDKLQADKGKILHREEEEYLVSSAIQEISQLINAAIMQNVSLYVVTTL